MQNKWLVKMITSLMTRDFYFWSKVLESKRNTCKITKSQKSLGMPSQVLEKQLLSIKLQGLALLNYTRELSPRLVEMSRSLIKLRDNLNFISFNNWMIPKILTQLLEDPKNKLLQVKKLLSFHHLQVSLDILDLAKPVWLPVSKVK